jgi:hypothetical protein
VIKGMIAADVPPAVDFDLVRSSLLTGQKASRWDFSIGVRGDAGEL